MDNYQNRQPPEGINTTTTHPARTFITLLAGMLLIIAVAAWLLGLIGGWMATTVSFKQEVSISKLYVDATAPAFVNMDTYLNGLAAHLTPKLGLPEGMSITVRYQNEGVENAFATLGGNIMLYRGLLKALPNENSLAMLIAHEMAHVKLRHPIRSLGQTMAISSGVKLLMGYSDVNILGTTGLLTKLHFSRAMETAADKEALAAVEGVYGHVGGALELYRTLHTLTAHESGKPEVAFFSTHPLDQARIDALTQLAKDQGWSDDATQTTPLPAAFTEWLEGESPPAR